MTPNDNPFATAQDFVQRNEKIKRAMEIFEKAQKRYDESMSASFVLKPKAKGSNSISTKGNYNVYISGAGRGY